jgi:cystathionine beta-lyase
MKSRFDQYFDRKGTYSTQWDYTIDRFGKENILPFSISDMDFQSPPEIIEAIKHRAEHGVFGYTRWNHDTFKNAISEWYIKRFSVKLQKNWIVYSPSVMYTISKLIEILTDTNDGVVIQTPAYDAFLNQIKVSGRQRLENPLSYKRGYYKLNFEDLELQLSQQDAKLLILCNPHNPTGRVWTQEELLNIIKLCDQYGVKIISDDIHMDMTLGDHSYTPILSITGNYENIFICTSSSKTFNTPSLGGSYAFIPNEKVRAEFMETIKYRDGVSNAMVFGMLSVIEGYYQSGYWVDELQEYIYQNMLFLKHFIAEELPELKFQIPESTYLAWIDCNDLNVTSEQLQEVLVHVGNVGIMPGDVYKAGTGVFLRMNVGCPKSKLRDGLNRLKMAINAI